MVNMINNVTLVGNLTKDPELKYTNSGTAVCNFTLAVASGFGDKQKVDFINIVVWGALGENCGKYLVKGQPCAIVGKITTGSYTAKDGTKRYTTQVTANEVMFLYGKNTATTGGGFGEDARSAGGFADEEGLPF